MKRFFITFILGIVLGLGVVNAQVEPAHFFDNTSISLKGGITTPLSDFGTLDFENVGIEIEKWINPWLGVSADGNFYIGNNIDTYTTFDYVNVSGLVKFNVVNMFGTFNGTRRLFEPSVFTGIGWGHRTASLNDAPMRNFMTYKAGVDFDFNLGKDKAWAVRLQPTVIWACPNSGKLSKNNAELQVNLGVVYRFRNHDGNRTFTMVRRYDQNEIDGLNNQINELRNENGRLNDENACLRCQLSNVPTTVVTRNVERVDTVMLMPRTQFYVNSARIVETSLGNVYEMAEYMKSNPNKNYTIVGYASSEGSEAYNLNLSRERAEALRDKLVEYGVNPNQLTVDAKGATERFSTDNRTMNRVVIVEENR